PTNNCPANGPNFPSERSQTTPLADWPIFLYGKRMTGGTYSGIFAASVMNRLLVIGSKGFGPMADFASGKSYHANPPGWQPNLPGHKCCSAHVPFHGPWLSV